MYFLFVHPLNYYKLFFYFQISFFKREREREKYMLASANNAKDIYSSTDNYNNSDKDRLTCRSK